MTALLARIFLGPGRLPELLVPCETEIVQKSVADLGREGPPGPESWSWG